MTFSIVIELEFDDENGEYAPPSPRQLERAVDNLFTPRFLSDGYKVVSLEAAEGTLNEAFGIGEDED